MEFRLNAYFSGSLDNKSAHRQKAKELAIKAGEGSESAFGELYDMFADAMFGIVVQIVQSDEVGSDVLQDAFVKIWKNISSFDPEKGSVFTWMLNISRNTAIDYIRKQKKMPLSKIQEEHFDVSKGNSGIGDEGKTNHIGIGDLLQELPDDHQLVIRYLYFKGYTQQELSDELGIPLGTVKTRARMAIKSLRKYFNILLFWI